MSVIIIENAIPAEALSAIQAALARGSFVRIAEGENGERLNLVAGSAAANEATALLLRSLDGSASFKAATWVDAMLQPLFSRYESGMQQRRRFDGALLGEPPMAIRCDIVVTICLNDGTAYRGGELSIDVGDDGSRGYRGKAGDVLVQPADAPYRISAVTSGTREIATLFLQSMIRDGARRRILYDLKSSLDVLDRTPDPPPHVEALKRSYFNLIRMWVDP